MATKLKFGSSAPKCPRCNKSAYPKESITYDQVTYHRTCFKCLQCKSSVSLSAVAMIQGDLYCKNCFVRMFSERGTYSVFGDKTLPKAQRSPMASPRPNQTPSPRPSGAAADNKKPDASANDGKTSQPATAAVDGSVAHVSVRDRIGSFAAQGRRGSIKLCTVADCGKSRVSRKSYCADHLNQHAGGAPAAAPVADSAKSADSADAKADEAPKSQPDAAAPSAAAPAAAAPAAAAPAAAVPAAADVDAGASDGFKAIKAALSTRSVPDVRKAVKEHGVQVLFEKSQRKTLIELAFAGENVACGQVLLDELEAEFIKLKATVAASQ